MKTADCPEVRAVVAIFNTIVKRGDVPDDALVVWRSGRALTLADILSDARNAILEAMLDNGRWQIRHECSLCQCDDLPLVFCSGPYGTTLRCSDCANHLRYEPIPLWGDYCPEPPLQNHGHMKIDYWYNNETTTLSPRGAK